MSEDTYEDLIKRSDYVPAHRDMSEDAEETVAGPGAQTVGANKARLLKQFLRVDAGYHQPLGDDREDHLRVELPDCA